MFWLETLWNTTSGRGQIRLFSTMKFVLLKWSLLWLTSFCGNGFVSCCETAHGIASMLKGLKTALADSKLSAAATVIFTTICSSCLCSGMLNCINHIGNTAILKKFSIFRVSKATVKFTEQQFHDNLRSILSSFIHYDFSRPSPGAKSPFGNYSVELVGDRKTLGVTNLTF